jgi:uncharacterized delta-60 repeat protein
MDAANRPRHPRRALLAICLVILMVMAIGPTPASLLAQSPRDTLDRAITAMAVSQSSGKLVLVDNNRGNINLRRFDAHGLLDNSFGSGGIVESNLEGDARAYALALGPNDGVVVAGSTTIRGDTHFLVALYSSDGRRIANFDDDGQVITAVEGSGVARAVAIQPDGKILVAGTSYESVDAAAAGVGGGTVCCETRSSGVVIRYNRDGSLDTSFGDDGSVRVPRSHELAIDVELRALAIEDDGNILLAGTEHAPGATSDFLVLRLDPDGQELARSSLDYGGDQGASAMALQPDGKIVLAGYSGGYFAAVRLMPDLDPDRAFGGPSNVQDGRQLVAFVGGSGEGRAEAVRIQGDGKIVLAGVTKVGRDDETRFALARLEANGWLDHSFNGDGKRTFAFDSAPYNGGRFAQAFALGIGRDGKVWAGGRVCRVRFTECRPVQHVFSEAGED